MELKEALLRRRSIRKFAAQPVPEAAIEEMLHAAMSGPSACNRRPWEFYAVSNEAVLAQLRKATHFSNMNAPLAMVVCGRLDRALPGEMASYWIQDCSAATQNILLRATDLGLGTVWCGLYPQKRGAENAARILGLGENCVPLSLIFVVYPAEEQEARDQYEAELVHYIR